ncbi:MAG: PhoH family protein [Alphaproteobacteria bacterium]|nr:PhoH family protein [Alphaproteobacteria bacterium]MCB9795388.1 PhoH family protein [Alphaproteobacteria bacterium]
MPEPIAESPLAHTAKCFVLDTNVLLYDPNALNVFDEHELVIPITVIEEIDRFKKDLNETGRNARLVSRQLDALREKGSLSNGVDLPRGGLLRVMLPAADAVLPPSFGPRSNDNIILATALTLSRHSATRTVVLVTRDTNMRIKADALGLRAEDYEHAHVSMDEHYSGVLERTAPGAVVAALFAEGRMDFTPGPDELIRPNQFIILQNEEDPKRAALARYVDGQLRLIDEYKRGVWGIRPRNKEQRFAVDLLLDDSVSLVTLDGVAGTGKTLMAIACGLQKAVDEQRYRRLVVSRPIFPLGRDMGFLPGDISEKLNPWMKPIFDNLELLIAGNDEDERRRGAGSPPSYQPLLDQGMIEVEPLTYIRGRSLPRQYLIVDEAQNLTPHEVKTVLTRAGEGTKIILTGDPQQIDNPYVDATSNGLTYVVERFKDHPEAGHVTLRRGERSRLAELATQLL